MTTRRANPSITGAPRPMHASTRLSASRVFEILSRDSFSITVLILHATSHLSVYCVWPTSARLLLLVRLLGLTSCLAPTYVFFSKFGDGFSAPTLGNVESTTGSSPIHRQSGLTPLSPSSYPCRVNSHSPSP